MIHQRHATSVPAPRAPRPRSAFSLLEILVVIAVITLLIAILLPTLSAARRSSRKVACQSNLRQLCTAWQSYLDQFDGHFFQRVNANVIYGGRQGKGAQTFGSNPNRPVQKPLNTFLNVPLVARDGAEVFQCPADIGGASIRPSCFQHYGTSYVTNQVIIGQNQVPVDSGDPCATMWEELNTRIADLRRSQVTVSEAKLILLGDMGWLAAQSGTDPTKLDWHGAAATHNIAFLDGHVEFLKIRKGLHATEAYTILPFDDVQQQAFGCQQEVAP